MSVFPNFGNIDETIANTIKSRAGNNVLASGLMPWLRITSGAGKGLIIQSVTVDSSFKNAYGNNEVSGIVGTSFDGTLRRAYGTTRGLRPSPIIESIDLESGHYGLSRKANFNIKCFTLAQAELVTKYFLEPGMHILVDFGWNVSDSISQNKNLDACEMARFSSFTHIIKKRKDSKGTYDGFMGIVTGGGISLGDDETYNVEVKLTTLGEIPAYLQTHKGAINNNNTQDKDSTGNQFDVADINSADTRNDLGDLIWMQMYNRLPGHKRTEEIKKLRNKPDRYGRPFKAAPNFINMDDKAREVIATDMDELIDPESKKSIAIPDGVKIFTEESYIRLEVAFAILNTYQLNLKPKDSSKCGVKTNNYEIDCSWVVIGAHKHMFSTDESKLYIPNTKLPDFGLSKLINPEVPGTPNKIDIKNTVNGNPFKLNDKGNKDRYSFPSTIDLESDTTYHKNVKSLPDTINTNAAAFNWGYLEDLYFNFNYFVSLLESPNFVAKDVYYSILNACSEACNSFWQFEIVEHPERKVKNGANKGADKLTVADFNFTGQVSQDSISNIPTFEISGVNSPFLTIGITMDIPGMMASSILARKLNRSTNPDVQIEGKDSKIISMFGGLEDEVAKILNGLTPNEAEPTDDTSNASKNQSSSNNPDKYDYSKAMQIQMGSGAYSYNKQNTEQVKKKEQIKQDITIFSNRGKIVPLLQDRDILKKGFFSGTDTTLDNDKFVIGIYNDSILLKILENGNLAALEKYNTGDNTQKDNFNPRLLPISVDFEILGVSGLKVGDLFKLSGIPNGFDKPYQILNITQSVTGDLWVTKVKAEMRNI